MTDIIQRLKEIYAQWDHSALAHLEEIYEESVVFEDPIHHVKGLQGLKEYFESTLPGLKHCNFEFDKELVVDDHIAIAWKMRFSHRKLKKGKELCVHGISTLVLKNKIIYQRDYYDMTEMVFDHVPVLGSVTKYLKGRMSGAQV